MIYYIEGWRRQGEIMKNMLIKKTIVIAIGLLIIFCSLATVYMDNLSTKLYDEMDMYLTNIINQTALTIKNRIDENLVQLQTISVFIQQNDLDTASTIECLKQLDNRDDIKRYGIAALNGDVITSDQQSFNIFDRQYFQSSINGNTSASEMIADYIDGELINVCSVPIYNKKQQVMGVLFATFYTDKLANILASTNYENIGYSFIFNKEGDILLSNHTDKFNNIEELDNFSLKDIKSNEESILKYKDNKGNLNYLVYTNINDKWLVAYSFPQKILTKEYREFIKTAIITWVIIAIGSAFLIAYFYFKQRKNKLQIMKLAYEDEITEYYNYHRFLECCKEIKCLSNYILVNCDIKGFKWFNEIYGEDIANKLLKHIMKCFNEYCQNNELGCRHSADHFVFLLNKDTTDNIKKRLFKLAQMIRGEFIKEYLTSSYYFHFGVYEILDNDVDINLAFKKTQYTSKDLKVLSRDDVTFYQEEVFQKNLYALQIEKEFQNSLTENYFKPYIQPKVNLKTGKVNSGEILTRWHHPRYGIISPGDFIPIYEKNGMLEVLDFYIFEKSLLRVAEWKKDFNIEIKISINASRTYVFHEGYVDKVVRLVKLYEVDPKQVEIEITETTAVNHKEELIIILNELKENGFTIALDDFGSGYSSMNMLKDFPIDVVKIDQEFFRTNDATHMRSHIILEGIIELCHKLDFEVIAEGIETSEQRNFLLAQNCDYVQGYLYYKPMLLDEFERLFVIKEEGK